MAICCCWCDYLHCSILLKNLYIRKFIIITFHVAKLFPLITILIEGEILYIFGRTRWDVVLSENGNILGTGSRSLNSHSPQV